MKQTHKRPQQCLGDPHESSSQTHCLFTQRFPALHGLQLPQWRSVVRSVHLKKERKMKEEESKGEQEADVSD